MKTNEKALCNFSINFGSRDPSALIQTAKTELAKHGGQLTGDMAQGEFSVASPSVEGWYSISGNEITFVITKKPWYAPCGLIEGKLKEYLQA
jgi:hypothetical protein